MNVEVWLTELGLEQYANAFAKNGIDLSLLPELTNEDLKDLGIDRLVDRKTILKAIARASETALEPTEDPPTPSAIVGERRQVTVLFADISGFTKLSNELGAEETHAMLNRYFEVVDGIVESYGGSIDKHMGDNVMAVFGAPIAHDDDTLRAVRAAIDIHKRMATLSDELPCNLSAHIGIASGQVVASGTGSDAHNEYTVTGDLVNLASRLQEEAASGETVVSDTVFRTVAGKAECESLGNTKVKGFEKPVRTWRIRALRKDNDGALATFVGRRAEIGQFKGVMEACRANGTGQAIVVRGEAGIGKTRLVAELAAVAENYGYSSHRGLVLDFGVGKGQDAIRVIVRSLLKIPQGSANTVRQTAAETAIANGAFKADQRVFLYDLLNLEQSVENRAMYDAMDNEVRNNGKSALVADLIRGSSAIDPVIVIIEDVHWANALMLKHIATMAGAVADCPALLVMTSRIEGYPLDQAWRAGTGDCPLTTIDLGPLRQQEAQTLADTFNDATDQFVKDCIERAGGNPLFLEQLLRTGETRGEEEVPGSIQSLVLARMDRLLPKHKQALQAASVIGQRFAPDVLRHLLDDSCYDCGGLTDNHLVRPEGDNFLFAHALIRDGVYASLLNANRKALHALAARWFAGHDLVLRAQHLDHAEAPDAPTAYLEAAEGQASLYHYEQALELVARGREIAEGTEYEFNLTSLHGRLLNEIGMVSESLAAYRHALSLATGDIDRCQSLIGIAGGLRLSSEPTEAFEALAQAEPIAVQHKLTQDLARLHHVRGNLYFPLGKVDACADAHRQGLDFARQAGSAEAEARSLGGIGDAAYMGGQMASAHRHFKDCVALCKKNGFGRIEVPNATMAGWTLYFLNDLHGSLAALSEAVDSSKRIGDRRSELVSLTCVLMLQYELGNMSDAPALIEHLQRLVELHGAKAWVPTTGYIRAQYHETVGQHQLAIEEIERNLEMMRETSAGLQGPRMLGYFAMLIDDPIARRNALCEAETMLRDGAVGHNHLAFYRYAIDACLRSTDWDGAEKYAAALEDFTASEPLPSSNLIIARGRALANHGRGKRDQATLQELTRLRDEVERIGLKSVLPALTEALATMHA